MILPIERFLNKINISKSGCWEWSGSKTKGGYGQFIINTKKYYTHRFIYEYYHGQICPDLQIDHLCRVRACCNPTHLEQVTQKENMLRGSRPNQTHCKRGHELSGNNLYTDKKKHRTCITCRQINRRKYYLLTNK
jgi:hypothetical protein